MDTLLTVALGAGVFYFIKELTKPKPEETPDKSESEESTEPEGSTIPEEIHQLTDEEAVCYRNNNPELANVFGNNLSEMNQKAKEHWISTGSTEKRSYTCPVNTEHSEVNNDEMSTLVSNLTARYGVGDQFLDVTTKMKTLISDGVPIIHASEYNNLFTDPAPRLEKKLIISRPDKDDFVCEQNTTCELRLLQFYDMARCQQDPGCNIVLEKCLQDPTCKSEFDKCQAAGRCDMVDLFTRALPEGIPDN